MDMTEIDEKIAQYRRTWRRNDCIMRWVTIALITANVTIALGIGAKLMQQPVALQKNGAR
jgi:hypothetical protein